MKNAQTFITSTPSELEEETWRSTNYVDLDIHYAADKLAATPSSNDQVILVEGSNPDAKLLAGKKVTPTGEAISATDGSTLMRYRAQLNRALLWMSCKKGEMLDGDPSKLTPGHLDSLLGKRLSPEVLSECENNIIKDFNDTFSNDLELVSLDIKPDVSNKKVILTMLLRDKVTGKIQAGVAERGNI